MFLLGPFPISFILHHSQSLSSLSLSLTCRQFGPDWPKWGLNITDVVANMVHAKGMRSMAATSKFLPSVAEHETLFLQDAMDVVYSYGAVNAVEARTAVNKLRGITPPA